MNNTYQSIDKSFLLEYLGFRNGTLDYIIGLPHSPSVSLLDDELKVFAVKQGWTDKGQQYFLLNKEDVIKPKKIISKIEFDSTLYERTWSVYQCINICTDLSLSVGVAAILSTDD